ncbi:MAG: nucleoside-diphosphate-sugar epimerase [Firmicutes bacterium]|nr:nucleoside-diphosphate-sugar epimerase [Bacillota bacterium]
MKVLVTGATGFVGACLARHMVAEGHEVHVFTREKSNRWRIQDLSDQLRDHFVDLTDADCVQTAISHIRPEGIFHLATYGGFADQQDTTAIITANFLGTVNLVRACERVGFDFFINTGSSSEYGIKQEPMRETDVAEPMGDYGVSKLAATAFCYSEAVQKELPIVTIRLFSPYGYWDDPKRFIPYVIQSFLKNEVPRLSTPHSVRDYIFIEDILQLYQKMAETPKLIGGIFNAGSGLQTSIGEVVEIIREIMGSEIVPAWGSIGAKRMEPSVWVADTDKTRQLGWQARVDLREGLRRTIEWQKVTVQK